MRARRKFVLKLPSRTLVLGERTLIMGVLNVTPDSFSDGGEFLDPRAAVRRALEIERQGADILDIGGESTRPGSLPVTSGKEIRRVLPVLEGLRGRLVIPISIDTRRSLVAELAVASGAEILNDVSALSDPGMGRLARERRLPIILMHMRGHPRTMHKGPFARDVLADVKRGLGRALARAHAARIPRAQILLDPGIGFGKNYVQNFELLARFDELARLGFPLVAGVSRKAFIGAAVGSAAGPAPPEARVFGTTAAVTAAILGGAHIVRVHDVAEMRDVVHVADAVRGVM